MSYYGVVLCFTINSVLCCVVLLSGVVLCPVSKVGAVLCYAIIGSCAVLYKVLRLWLLWPTAILLRVLFWFGLV